MLVVLACVQAVKESSVLTWAHLPRSEEFTFVPLHVVTDSALGHGPEAALNAELMKWQMVRVVSNLLERLQRRLMFFLFPSLLCINKISRNK